MQRARYAKPRSMRRLLPFASGLLAILLGACAPRRSAAPLLPPGVIHAEATTLKNPPDPRELRRVGEAVPVTRQLLRLNKNYWLNRTLFISTAVERSTLPGLTGSIVGYLPIQLTREGDTLVLTRLATGARSNLTQDPALNAYPILSETPTELLVDLSAPRSPYAIAGWLQPNAAVAVHTVRPDFDVLKSIEVGPAAVTFSSLITLHSETRLFAEGSPAASLGLDPYRLTMTLRTDWVLPAASPSFEPLTTFPGFFGFLSLTATLENSGDQPRELVRKIDLAKPQIWELHSVPDGYVDAITQGIEGWNPAFGQRVLQVRRAKGDGSYLDPRTSTLVWDDTGSSGASRATAQMRTNPYTGEIVQSTIYLPGEFWLSNAALTYEQRHRTPTGPSPTPVPVPAPPPSPPDVPGTPTPPEPAPLLPELESRRTPDATPARWVFSLSAAVARDHATPGETCALEPSLPTPGTTPESESADVIPMIPEKVTLEEFQRNVLRATVLHEVGHTVGLRHNFKGSLRPSADGKLRSSSIMDYNDDVVSADFTGPGDFDRALITAVYGASPAAPQILFCTDEDRVANRVACLEGDAGEDPYAFLAQQQLGLLAQAGTYLRSGAVAAASYYYAQSLLPLAGIARTLTQPTGEAEASLAGVRLGGRSFAELQQRNGTIVVEAQNLFGLTKDVPEGIRRAYADAVVETLAAQVGPSTPLSESYSFVLDLLGKAVVNDQGLHRPAARLHALAALQTIQHADARARLKGIREALAAHTGMEDEDIVAAIDRILREGYFKAP
jgi:hypothetical protein